MRWLVLATSLNVACATASSIDDDLDAASQRDGSPTTDAAPADAPPIDAAPIACEGGDINVVDPGSGHCYMVFNTNRNWNGASSSCNTLGNGAHLVTIFDATENQVVRNLRAGKFWIGAADVATEGNFVWVTGETINSTFENWDGGEPNNSGNEDCAEMRDNLTWNDGDCPDTQPYVCERP